MKRVIFYSWQSDLPNSTNRGFIEKALERATSAIASDDSIEVEPVIDRDTQGIAGSPDISATIFHKIEAADMMVADVSIIGRLENERAMPNPNVLIELGYAIKALGYGRVILVFNTAYGSLTDLPFDLRTRRIITYTTSVDDGEKATERTRLTSIFREHIGVMLTALPTEDVTEPAVFQRSRDGIETNQPNKIFTLRQELRSFLLKMDERQPLKFSDGGTVVHLIEGINLTIDLTTEFARLCLHIALMNDEDAAIELHKWFGNLVERFDVPVGHLGYVNEQDADYFLFLSQEFYTVLIAALLKEERWHIIKRMCIEWIPVGRTGLQHSPGKVSFKEVARFIRSLSEEGKRRSLLSLQGTMLIEHFRNEELAALISFDDYMAADLLIFLIAEMAEAKDPQFYMWRPVSLIYLNGTPLFLQKAQRSSYVNHLLQLTGIDDLKEFKTRLKERLPKIRNLFGNELRRWPISNDELEAIGSLRG